MPAPVLIWEETKIVPMVSLPEEDLPVFEVFSETETNYDTESDPEDVDISTIPSNVCLRCRVSEDILHCSEPECLERYCAACHYILENDFGSNGAVLKTGEYFCSLHTEDCLMFCATCNQWCHAGSGETECNECLVISAHQNQCPCWNCSAKCFCGRTAYLALKNSVRAICHLHASTDWFTFEITLVRMIEICQNCQVRVSLCQLGHDTETSESICAKCAVLEGRSIALGWAPGNML